MISCKVFLSDISTFLGSMVCVNKPRIVDSSTWFTLLLSAYFVILVCHGIDQNSIEAIYLYYKNVYTYLSHRS